MVTRIFWRETKRGQRLVEKDQHFETTLGSVDIGFAWDAPKDKFQVGISSGISEWSVIARDLSLDEAKATLVRAMEQGVEVQNRWFNSREKDSKRTRFVGSAFARIIENRGAENVTFQLDKIVGLPGQKKVQK